MRNLVSQDYDPLPLLELDLSHNSLSTLQRTAFVHLTNLEVLDLSGNPIEEVGFYPEGVFFSMKLTNHPFG